MATYNADKMAAGTQPKALFSAGGVNSLSQINQTTALALNDIINMVQLSGDPAINSGALVGSPYYGPVIIGIVLDCDALDSGNTLTFDLGDTGATNRFLSAVTTPQAGGYAIPTKSAVLGYAPFASSYGTYTTASLQTYTIQIKVKANPGSWANGKIRVLTEFTYDP